ncbi:D-3-phosphoglycerate dehydrogenase [Indibacter alkaliphilus LW1]|jgi:glyoxylate/hydroxypyruvate reductase A|uniref:D-3-phosphoglycerate dehydrogenase n=1 Tax=Indibacter alkaliphilus (strain CCUG 57479 / KCTC 22604 / LW1) TaxID=1189612 RepID=S2E3M0_INDAL|nr:glyoxylate/hydroxypyruvate reductase A [Indibacter alkaliphilus]EOZ99091.1 D-3-phosphoglycerate dehydrogenase [Indibacter alkaliphilus LW1]
MALAIISPGRDVRLWIENFKELDPEIDIQVYPEITDPEKVEAVALWNHPKGMLSDFPNLKLICSMGAGVDHILSDNSIQKDIPITRIIDDKLTTSMTNYVVMGVLNYHRQINRYQEDQKNKVWDMSNPEIPVTVGIMGVGELGGDIAEKLQQLRFDVVGYGNTHKENMKYPYFFGDEIHKFLSKINILVCMLPLTPKTEGILNLNLFRKCNKNTYLVNVARGKHLVEEDLLEAIDEGYISGALLDVFQKEPLPEEHPFWNKNEITITPHIASVTNPKAAAPQIIENYHRIKKSQPFINQINPKRGY